MRETAGGKEELAFYTARTFVGTGLGRPRRSRRTGRSMAVATGPTPPAEGPGSGVQMWDPDSGRKLFALKGYKGLAAALAISPDGKRLALARLNNPPIAAEPNEVLMWPLADGKAASSFKPCCPPGQGVISLAFSPDGGILAAGDLRGGVAVWDAVTGADRWQATPINEQALAPVVFSPDGRLLAAASRGPQLEDGKIRIYEVASGKVRREFAGRFGPVTSLAFSPDGRVLAAGCQDTTILLFDAVGAYRRRTEAVGGGPGRAVVRPRLVRRFRRGRGRRPAGRCPGGSRSLPEDAFDPSRARRSMRRPSPS